MKTILITGGAGFIGSNFVRYALKQNFRVINLDKLTYAGNLNSLRDVIIDPNHIFVKGSINDRELIIDTLTQYQPDAVINFAAESHVDRSIDDPGDFIQTNIVGTFELLEATRTYWANKNTDFRFLHISTDEVYGSLGHEGFFSEKTPYAPNSPYSASKASSDHLVRAYYHTYGFPVLTTNCSNNYGPFQFPEKLIPLVIINALNDRDITIYGNGKNIRDWLYVLDHCSAIFQVLTYGEIGQVYNVGGSNEKSNLDVVHTLCDLLDELHPRMDGKSYRKQITFVKDRPGHDQRYAIDSTKLKRTLNWIPSETFETGLRKTTKWYLENQEWCAQVLDGSYRGERLGIVP